MKKAAPVILLLVGIIGIPYVWWVHINYRFATVVENKVYKSGAIPPDKIADYIHRYKIKTVVDLRHPRLHDPLNPGNQDDIDRERAAVAKLSGVRHVNIPSDQVPTQETMAKFFEVMDDSVSYPVLIHCVHGTGRAMIYSALYRIEYEGFSNEDARAKTRVLLYGSSFDEGKGKGDFLIHYRPRKEGEKSTLSQSRPERTSWLDRLKPMMRFASL